MEIDRARHGPERLLQTQLAERYHGAVFRYFRRKGLDVSSAEDCAQETFSRINGIQLGHLHEPGAYLFRVASNVFLERGRRARARREEFHVPIGQIELVDKASSPLQAYEGREALQTLGVMLQKLPPRTREVFLLNRLDGLTYTQIATRFGVSVGTIEKQISSALARLRVQMDQHD